MQIQRWLAFNWAQIQCFNCLFLRCSITALFRSVHCPVPGDGWRAAICHYGPANRSSVFTPGLSSATSAKLSTINWKTTRTCPSFSGVSWSTAPGRSITTIWSSRRRMEPSCTLVEFTQVCWTQLLFFSVYFFIDFIINELSYLAQEWWSKLKESITR